MTKNKIEILETIRNSDKHLSAEEIYFMVKVKILAFLYQQSIAIWGY